MQLEFFKFEFYVNLCYNIIMLQYNNVHKEESMSEINLKKRVKSERFRQAVLKFIFETQTVQDIIDENGFLKGGYIDYYLFHSDEYSKEELADNIKFCSTVQYLGKAALSDYVRDHKTITVRTALFLASSHIIFQYKYYDKKFQEWQYQVYELLTFQNLTC